MTTTVDVQGAPVESQIDYVGSAAAQASNSSPRVTVPGTAAVGDRLVLALSLNNTTRTVSAPTGVTGWTQLDDVVAGDMRTVVWTKVVQAGDPGTSVTVPLSGSAKHTLTVAAYTGVVSTPGLDVRRCRRHRQPCQSRHAGRHGAGRRLGHLVLGRQVQYDDRVDGRRPRSRVVRCSAAPTAAGSAACSPTPDGAVPGGAYPGATATTDAPSSKATTWSIVLAPGD